MEAEHRIRWFVRDPGSPDDWQPRTSTMRGPWPWDVRCSCGMETRTGGATEASIRRMIADHRVGLDAGWRPIEDQTRPGQVVA